jgi:hypothetical protein
MLLDAVNHSTYMKLKDLLLENTDILENEMSKLEKENAVKIIDKAMKAVVLKADSDPFTNIDELIEAVNDALDDAKESTTTGGGGSGGGGGGGGSSSGGGSTIKVSNTDKTEEEKPAQSEKTELNKEPFSDMNGFEWADKAVNSLYESGVINGTGSGKFEPERTVNREEIVKMIVEAFKIGTAEDSGKFADVKGDDWFAPYVAKAVEMGIVNGVTENSFGTGERITREDMATIIYRTAKLLNIAFAVNKVEFNDWNNIADYAKTAVECLSGNGVVNGVGDGNFAPKAFATRAEAAVIIFRCMEGI